MTQQSVAKGVVIEDCHDGTYEAVNLRDLRRVAERAAAIASDTREGIILHYGPHSSIAVGAKDKVGAIHARLQRGERDAVRVRSDGTYVMVSRSMREVANAIVNLVCSKGKCILLHRPNGDYLMKVCPQRTTDSVRHELKQLVSGAVSRVA